MTIIHHKPYFTSAPLQLIADDPRYAGGMWCVDANADDPVNKETIWVTRACLPVEPTPEQIQEIRAEACREFAKKGIV